MKATRINDADIAEFKIASLPSRPTAPRAFGGRGYTASEMKAAFDKLPLYIIERFNMLLEDIAALGEDSLAAEIPTGLAEGHTLSDLFADLASGALATYLKVAGVPLTECIEDIESELSQDTTLIAGHIAKLSAHEKELAEHDSRLAGTESAIAAQDGRISETESAIAAANARIDAIDTSGGNSIDIENITIDCGTPADLITTEGGN